MHRANDNQFLRKMNYKEAIDYLYTQLPMFQRSGAVAYKNNLDNTLALDKHYGAPHHAFKSIHVAGTNGKGSVSHMLAAILQSAGYSVGLFTSPHLKDFRERIRVNGKMIEENEVSEFMTDFSKFREESGIAPSFFELTVPMAFTYYKEKHIDFAVVEVGLGGRLDCTNIITPEVSIITNISFDHMALLGNTLSQIATEKAGIIKKEIPVVVGTVTPETAPIFQHKCEEIGTSMVVAGEKYKVKPSEDGLHSIYEGEKDIFNQLEIELKGFYQMENVATVYAAIVELRKKGIIIPDEAIRNGISKVTELTGLMGRWQKLGEHPPIICDTGHNEGGFKFITEQLSKTPYHKLHIVMGVVNDKDVSAILKLLPKQATYYFTRASIERALDPKILQEKAKREDLHGDVYNSVKEALLAAKKQASPDDMIYVGGSTFIVAEVV